MSKFEQLRPVRRSGEGAKRYSLLSQLILLLAGMIGLGSCETLVNTIPESKLPKTESQLTLFSFISPQDSVIKVRVGQTTPVFSTVPVNPTTRFEVVDGDTIYLSPDVFSKATVTLSDGEASATLPYRASEEVYALSTRQFPIRAGKTYTLTVTDGTRTARATCTVPVEEVPIKSYTLDTVMTNTFGRRDTSLHLDFTWNDLPAKANYYRMKAFELFEYSVVTINTNEIYVVEKRKQERLYFSWTGTSSRSIFQNDVNLDGTVFSSPQGRKKLENAATFQQLSGNEIEPTRGPQLLGVYLQLLNTDANYYLYHRSVQQSRGDNPFSEPSLVYTNVTDGLGVFAAYTLTNKIIKP